MYCPCPYHERKESLILYKSNEKNDVKLDVKCTSKTHDKPTLYKCTSCNLIFSEHIKKNFEEEYSKVEDTKYIEQIPFKEKYFKLFLNRIKPFLKKKSNVLEIGSYYGVLGNLIKPYVDNYTGLELSKHAAEYSKKKYSLNVMNDSLYKFLNKNFLFDVIVMSDVVEHLDDPFRIFNLIEKNLKPDGVLIFTTFNMDALIPKILGRKYHWIMPMHKFYFTDNTIKYSLNNNNMEIINIKKDTRLISVEYLLYKLSILIRAFGFLFKFLLRFDFIKKRTIKINLYDLNIYFVKKIYK
jgi:2-polyprenyl-3-methyl-5-hydroxy-6-metoxy-1,4-benzoquinol methylase